MKKLIYLFISTIFIGCLVYPLMLFTIACINGHGGDWTFAAARDMATANFFLAALISLMMWCVA